MADANVTIGEWISQSARRAPDRTALVAPDRTLTYAELDSRVNRLVHALAGLGVGRGDRIAVLARDSIAYVETVLAAMKLGATYVPLNVRLADAEIERLLARAAPAVVVHDERYDASLDGSSTRPTRGVRITVDGAVERHGGSGDAIVPYEELLAASHDDEPTVVGDDDDVLGLAFTSGTTGLPKGVLQSQRMIKAMCWNVMVDYRLQASDTRYSAAPLFHISGLAMTLMGIAIGSTTVIEPQFDPGVTLDLLASDRLDACFLVPTMISSVLAQPGVDTHSYDRLRLMLYGAAPMTPSLLGRAMDVFGCDFLNAFGAGTEAGLQTVLTPEDHRRAAAGDHHLLGSIGRPATGVTVRIVDDDGHEVADGEIGEIASRSDSVMDGYLDMPDATSRALRDGWFRAGDLAHRDAEGYLYLAGRKNDMIIRGGENIHPLEVEAVLAAHRDVREAAVVGVPDDHWGETVRAVLVVRPGAQIDVDDVIAHCRSHLASFKVPTDVRTIDALPLNASGKVRRDVVRDLVGAITRSKNPEHTSAGSTSRSREMKTPREFRESLADGRVVYFQGARIDVTEHPAFARAIGAMCATYERFHSDADGAVNPLFGVPRSADDLRERIRLLRESDVVASTTFQSLLSLLTASDAVSRADPVYGERIAAYYEYVVANDLRLTECITDAKGDRSVAPGGQQDPDAYVRVVERRSDGVVIRGAKLHITGAPLGHELVIMPTKHMKPGEEAYAISCAVPVGAPGVSIVATTFDPWPRDPRDFVFSCHESMPDGFVIFDDVFVPHERVFLDGDTQYSSNFAHALGLWERLGGTSLLADEADLLVGLAQLVADANGLTSIPHVREKISEIIMYATLIRGSLEAALTHVGTTPDGMVYPSELYTNAAKFYGAANYSVMTRHLHDIAGGIVATAPGSDDLANVEVGGLLRKYLVGSPSMSPDERLAIMRGVRDFTADTFGGWRFVTNLQSGGGLYAQRLVVRKHYDMHAAVSAARHELGLDAG